MGSGSVRSSHQTVSDYPLRHWFPNTLQSRFLTACRRLEKLVLPSIFDTILSSLTMWTLQSYPTTVLNERMWHFKGSKQWKHSLTPPTYFRGSTPQPPGSTPLGGIGGITLKSCGQIWLKFSWPTADGKWLSSPTHGRGRIRSRGV